MKRRVYQDNVNYLKYDGKRKMLAHYLKAGGFKKIGGAKIHGDFTDRRRYVMAAIAVLVFLAGIWFVIF